MTIITLVFTNPANASNVVKKKIAWDTLFGHGDYAEEFIFSRKAKVQVTYVNNLLQIETQSKVDVFLNINAAPINGVHVKTRGGCMVVGAMNLDLGLLVIASDIDLDAAIISPGLIGLDTSDNPDGKVYIKKKIAANNIGVLTNQLYNESHVNTNQALIFCKTLTMEILSCLSVGNVVSFKKGLKDINADAVSTWRMISTSQKLKQFSQEIRYICADTVINNGTLNFRDVELHIADKLTHANGSKTTYDHVKIFSVGSVHVCEHAAIDGNNTFLKSNKSIDIDGECKINNFTIFGANLNVNGILWGNERLDVQVAGDTVCKGLIGSEHTRLISNSILVTLMSGNVKNILGFFNKGGIVGARSLNINALGMMVAGGGYLYSPSVQSRTAFYANFAGMVCAFNFVNRSVFVLDFGINAPCLPTSFSDLANAEKIFRLSCRVMGNSFPMLRNAATFGTLAAPLGKFIKSAAASTAKQSSNVVHGLYNDPKKQFHNGISAVNDLRNGVSETSKATYKHVGSGLDSISKTAKQVSSSSKEDFILKAKESMKQVSEAWSRTRWLDLLNYLLTMQDWYISADMIMMQSTSALVFANDAKICLRSPSATLEGIANNFATTFNNAKATLADPSLVNNIYNASIAQIEEFTAVPINVGKKLYSQGVGIVETVTNPFEAVNKISESLGNAVTSITLEHAKKGMLDPLLKKKCDLLEASNNLCFGSDQLQIVNEVNCDVPLPEEPLVPAIEENPAHAGPENVEAVNDIPAANDIPVTNDIPAANEKPTLDKKISPFKQTILDVAVMFAPSIDKRAAISSSGGLTISGSVMEDNLFNSHNGVTAAISSSNYSLFGFHNSGGIYSNYRNEFVGNRYNTGDVYVGAMHLNAWNNEEHGDFQYSEFIFDIARDFNTHKKTKMSDTGHIHGTVHRNFYGASNFSMSGGQFIVKGSYILEKDASHTIGGGAQFSAKNAEIAGNLASVNDAKIHVNNGTVHEGGKYSINGATHTGDNLTFKRGAKFVFSSGKAAVNDNFLLENGACSSIGGDAQLYAKNGNIFGDLAASGSAKVHFDYGIIHDGGKYAINGATHTGDSLTFKPGSIIDIREDIINVNTLDDQGAKLYSDNHITFAKNFTRGGNWVYKGFLHEQLDKITTTPESTLERADTDAEYSLDAKEEDFNGAEKHSRVLAHVAGMTTSDAVDYGLGRGKYSMIEVTEDVDISSESTENAEYAGGRANGARVQVQTKGRITLPSRFDRARGMTFENYEEAEYFDRAVYATHNVPPPQPKKRKGIKKYLNKISEAFADVAALFANGGDPITLAISAAASGLSMGADKLDKHYGRKDSRYLEQLELERVRLQQKLDLEGLSMQEKNFLASLRNQDHMRRVNSAAQRSQNVDESTYNDVISNTWSLEAARQQTMQKTAAVRQELNNQNERQLADISYHHARHRDDLSRLGGPVIGTGLALNAGSTGVTTSVTITAGNPGQVVTGRIPIANHDFNRPAIENHQGSEQPRALQRIRAEPVSSAEAARVGRALEDRLPGLLGEQEPTPQFVPVNAVINQLYVNEFLTSPGLQYVSPIASMQNTKLICYQAVCVSDSLDFESNPEITAAQFAKGVAAGVAMNEVIFKASSIKYVGSFIRRIGWLGAGVMVAEAFGVATEFERDNFIYTEEYEHIVNNPLISKERKDQLFAESIQRQAQARKEAEGLKDLVTKFKENPTLFGFGVGSFLTIEQLPGTTFAANAFMNLRIRFPFKSLTNDRHIEYLNKVVKSPPGVEYIEVAAGGANGFENFSKARTMAVVRSNLGDDAVPYLSTLGPHKNNVYVGTQSRDKRSLWRLDWDETKGAHINWKFAPGPNPNEHYSGAIQIDSMRYDDYLQIIEKFPRRYKFIGRD